MSEQDPESRPRSSIATGGSTAAFPGASTMTSWPG